MFDIYIKNYKDQNGLYQTNEILMYSIPMEPGEENALVEPKISVEMGKAGSFEFGMNLGHPFYDSLCQMKTLFRIVYDGDNIFRGRVLTIDVGHLTGAKQVHCEGDLAFLLDSQMEGTQDDKRPKTDALTYLNNLISQHNAQMDEGMADKKFVLGEVPGQYSDTIETAQRVVPDSNYRYGSGSWRDSQSAFNEIADAFGGFFRTRYQNGACYLDWIDQYFNTGVNTQTIELGENLIDLTTNSEVNNIFTAVIPIGSKDGKNIYIKGYKTDIHGDNNRILVPQITRVYTAEQLNTGFHSRADYLDAVNQYGIIYHTESFGNADTQAKLWEYACDWIKNNYIGGLNSFNITALDMHVIGESSGKFLVGDKVNVIYPDVNRRNVDPDAIIQKTLTVMGVTYELYHPEKNQYKIGIPNGILKKNYGEKKNKKSASKGSGSKEQKDKADEYIEKNWHEYTSKMVWQFVQDGMHNVEEYEDYVRKYGDDAAGAIARTALLAVGDRLNHVPGSTGKYSFYNMILDDQGITINNPMVTEESKKLAQDLNEATKALIIHTGQNAKEKTGRIDLMPVPPKEALNWGVVESQKFQRFVAASLTNDSTGKGAVLTTNTIQDQSAASAGKQTTTTFLDGVKGHLAGLGVDLAAGFEDVQKVVDQEALAGLKMNGPEASVKGGTGGAFNFELFGKGGEDGKSAGLDIGKVVKDIAGEDATKYMASLDGDGGAAAFGKALLGNLTGDADSKDLINGDATPTVKMDGEESTIEAGSGIEGQPFKFKVDGKQGREWVGRKPDGTWQVKLNEPVTYTDAKTGQTVTKMGFVSAEDFNIPNLEGYESFKNKLIITDQAIIGKADIADLTAVRADIAKITSDTIVANTQVRAANIQGTNGSFATLVSTGRLAGQTVVGRDIGWVDSDGHDTLFRDKLVKIGGKTVTDLGLIGYGNETFVNIPDAVTGFDASQEVGDEIRIPYHTYSSGSETAAGTINFKIADTKTYKDAVSAAETTGKKSVTLSGGSWAYDDNSGFYATVTASAPNTNRKTVNLPTITATQIGSKVYVYGAEASGDTHTITTCNVSGGSAKLTTLAATENDKTYTPPTGYDGFSSVTVNVPEQVIDLSRAGSNISIGDDDQKDTIGSNYRTCTQFVGTIWYKKNDGSWDKMKNSNGTIRTTTIATNAKKAAGQMYYKSGSFYFALKANTLYYFT